jgi:hypothetical protein
MATAYKNFLPPAGTVEVVGDPSWTWDGRTWLQNGRPMFPTGRAMRGKPGTALAGWFYDHGRGAWIEPSRPPFPINTVAPGVVSNPACPPAPVRITSIWDGLKNHPLVPVAGAALTIFAKHLVKKPEPPQVPAELPEAMQKMWLMQYEANLQTYNERVALLKDLGQLAVSVGVSQAQLSEIAELVTGRAA